jgi:hypothetical protein
VIGTDSTWLILAILIPAAVAAFWFGSRQFQTQLGASALEPRGRRRSDESSSLASEAAALARLQALAVTKISEARPGPARLRGTIVSAVGNLGGTVGRECIWRNRADASRGTAVGVETAIISDASGKCGVDGVERAAVEAPAEKFSAHHESVALYIGDEVEVMGTFEAEPPPNDASGDQGQHVYGTLGSRGPLRISVVSRASKTDVAEDQHP